MNREKVPGATKSVDPAGQSGDDAEAPVQGATTASEVQERSATPQGLAESWPCPFCGGNETELMSLFGSHASLSTYWCRSCGSPFETLRWRS